MDDELKLTLKVLASAGSLLAAALDLLASPQVTDEDRAQAEAAASQAKHAFIAAREKLG